MWHRVIKSRRVANSCWGLAHSCMFHGSTTVVCFKVVTTLFPNTPFLMFIIFNYTANHDMNRLS